MSSSYQKNLTAFENLPIEKLRFPFYQRIKMSRKFFKTVTAITAVCCLFFLAAGGFRLYKQASTRNHVTIRLFERLDKTFMNQLKINDAVPDELKTIFREEVRINPDIDSVTISKNNEEIFSARKTDASGIRVYNENKNLLIDRKSKPYALDETEIYTLTIRFRILSETDLNHTFFCLLMSFLVLSIIIAACAVVPLRRKKSPAGPLFDQIDIESQSKPHHPFQNAEDEPSAQNSDEPDGVNSFISDIDESDDEEDDILDLDELTADDPKTDENENVNYEPKEPVSESNTVIDLNFKESTFQTDAEASVEKAVERNENCVLLITEFRAMSYTPKEEMLQNEWYTHLIEANALCKTDRKKTVAILPRCTLTDGIKLIQDFRESRSDREDYMWNAGMTALNGRKLRYEDMYNEASRALIKSQLDNDNTVVCFNADAEKYNRYSKID